MLKVLCFAFAGCFTLAFSTSFILADPDPAYVAGFKCDLPAPKNITIAVGSTDFEISWDAVPEAAFYRINLFKSADDVMVVTKVVTALPGRNVNKVGGLTSNVSYYYTVSSICSNGMESPKSF